MNYRNAIIIEGPDCSGKTTLANRLREFYGFEPDVVHCTGHDPKDFDFYSQIMRKKNVIFDRHFVGEMVYPEVFNREPNLSEDEFNELASKTVEDGIPVIIVCPSEEILIERLHDERPNEEEEIVETICYAREKFYELAQAHPEFILVEPEDGNIDFDFVVGEVERVFNGD